MTTYEEMQQLAARLKALDQTEPPRARVELNESDDVITVRIETGGYCDYDWSKSDQAYLICLIMTDDGDYYRFCDIDVPLFINKKSTQGNGDNA